MAVHSSSSAGDERWDRRRTKAAFETLSELRRKKSADADRMRDELVVAHLNLVRYLAVKFVNRGEALDDLIQVGTVGLIKAIDRFDIERGVEFTTYATPTVVGEIKRYFRDKGWAVKVPRRLQELNLSVNRAIEKMTVALGRSPTVAELAKAVDASEEEILEAQELGQAYNLLSLDTELGGDSDKNGQTLADYIGKADPNLQLLEDRTNLEPSRCSPSASVSSCSCAFTSRSRRPRSRAASTSRRCTSRASNRRHWKSCAARLRNRSLDRSARLPLGYERE